MLQVVRIAIDNKAELLAMGDQNQELWTQNGLLREQNKTLKSMVVAIEDLALLIRMAENHANGGTTPGIMPHGPGVRGGADAGVHSQGPGNSGASGESRDALFASP